MVLQITGLDVGARGEERSLYSLRHTCIMYRLLYGDGLDLLTLARNARTSVEMIEKHYSHLDSERAIDQLGGEKTTALMEAFEKPKRNFQIVK